MVAASLEQDEKGDARFCGCSNIRDFEFLGKLGEGTFGEVYKGRSKKDGTIVALKRILMHNEKDGFPITALREIKLLKMLAHPNILQLREMAIERSKEGEGRKKASMYMVTPYMEHDLSGLLENPAVHFAEAQIKCYMLQLLKGIEYLHRNNILHRDMKAANLLISNKGILQIADFGLARPYDEPPPQPGKGGGEAKRDYTTLVVTRWYRPPELLLQLRRYTTAIDMWGVGCVFGEMFKGKPILAGSSDLNQIQLIFNLVGTPTEETMPGWSSLPGCEGVRSFGHKLGNLHDTFKGQDPTAVSLLTELLKLDWRKRINAIDALKHPYFSVPPLPAKPEELPRYEDSHELDRRRFRGQKAAMPPAPAGGSVGMGPNGEWTAGSTPRTGRDSRSSRVPSAVRPRWEHDAHLSRPSEDARYRDGSLPPKPQAAARPPWGRDGRSDYFRDRPHQPRYSGRPESSTSGYGTGGSSDRYRARNDYNPNQSTDGKHTQPYQSGKRGQRDYGPRRRSRSPGHRYGGHGERGQYRR